MGYLKSRVLAEFKLTVTTRPLLFDSHFVSVLYVTVMPVVMVVSLNELQDPSNQFKTASSGLTFKA